MTRSADGGIQRRGLKRQVRTDRCSRDAIGCKEPRSLTLRGTREEGGGKEKDFGLNVASSTDASRDRSCQYLATCYRFSGGHLPSVYSSSALNFFWGEGKGKIHIHGVICDDIDDDDVWHIEALRKTNLIGARRALRRCNAGRRGIMMTYVNGTILLTR